MDDIKYFMIIYVIMLFALMMAYYNYHLNFYHNYLEMLERLRVLAWKRYVLCTPARWLPRIAFLLIAGSLVFTMLAFFLPTFDGDPMVISAEQDFPPSASLEESASTDDDDVLV